MSTRCHIMLDDFYPMLYRHCDGYPGKEDGSEYGVLADLIPFLKAFKKERGWDPEYMLARLAQHLANKHCADSMLSYGVDLALHGDEEFVYLVKDGKVEVYATGDGFWDDPGLTNCKLIRTVNYAYAQSKERAK